MVISFLKSIVWELVRRRWIEWFNLL